jgi:hypothetical protein
MTSVGEHGGKTTVSCSKIEYAHRLRTDHPSDRRFRKGSPSGCHGGNFSGAGPAC